MTIRRTNILMLLGMFVITLLLALTFGTKAQASVYVYRVFNRSNGEHLYTTSKEEQKSLVCGGWIDEGVGWQAPDGGEAVYRLYNPGSRNHLYTTDENEVNELTGNQGWTADFNRTAIFYSGGSVPIYRLFTPSMNGLHHLTTDGNEYNVLSGSGWSPEGVKMYCEKGYDGFINPQGVYQTIMGLRGQYPEGMTWNNDNQYTSPAVGLNAHGCTAFALVCSDTAFGNLPANFHTDKNDIKVGDIVELNQQSTGIVLEVDGDMLTLAEGNYGGKIHWGRRISRSQTNITQVITRYPENQQIVNPGTPGSPSTEKHYYIVNPDGSQTEVFPGTPEFEQHKDLFM